MWEKYFGPINMKCPLCNINDISPLTCEIGHDLADSKGGSKTLDNVMPICRTCNSDQSNLTFAEFKRILPSTKITFETLNYDQRIRIVRRWCRDIHCNILNDDKIHKLAYIPERFNLVARYHNYKNLLIVSRSFFGYGSLTITLHKEK